MTSLYIASLFAKLSVDNPEAAKLLVRLDEAETGAGIQDALDKFDSAQG